ncbi:MAG: methionine--tRNA ligase subunit beta, partial [Candidatus Acidiferrales bacterium]
MSKSKGNVAYPEPIVKVLGNDALRYYLLRETVFGQDGNFSREALITRYNADLANGLGNLASRLLTMVMNYCGGRIPEFPSDFPTADGLKDPLVQQAQRDFIAEICSAYEDYRFSVAAEKVWHVVSYYGDEYLSKQKPWANADNPQARSHVDGTLYTALSALRAAVILAHPIIPEATQKIWEQLGQQGKLQDVRINQLQWGDLKSGTPIGKVEAVFPRADYREASERIEAMENEIRNPGSTQPAVPATPPSAGAAAPAAAPAPGAKIGIEDFAKVELRAGVIKSAERIQGADKLLKVMVDIGDEVRQVLAGIALSYAPEDLVGRKVVVVTNLAPRKMRGLESNGMLLAAVVGPEGKPVLCTFAEDVDAGSKVK